MRVSVCVCARVCVCVFTCAGVLVRFMRGRTRAVIARVCTCRVARVRVPASLAACVCVRVRVPMARVWLHKILAVAATFGLASSNTPGHRCCPVRFNPFHTRSLM